jgi:hypothetical protein
MSAIFYETITTSSLPKSWKPSCPGDPDNPYIIKSITYENVVGLLSIGERNEPGMMEDYRELQEIVNETR